MHQNKSLPGEEPCLLWGDFSVLKKWVLFCFVSGHSVAGISLWKWFRQLHPHTATGVQVGFSFSGDRVICVTKSKRISPNEATVNIYKGSLLRKWHKSLYHETVRKHFLGLYKLFKSFSASVLCSLNMALALPTCHHIIMLKEHQPSPTPIMPTHRGILSNSFYMAACARVVLIDITFPRAKITKRKKWYCSIMNPTHV